MNNFNFQNRIRGRWLLFAFCTKVLLTSCSQGDESTKVGTINPTALYNVKIDPEGDSLVRSSTIFESVSFLKLERREGALIGNIDKILFDKDQIFIVDKEVAQAIFIFDHEGKLISKIDEKGKGPAEFMGIRDMALDSENERVCLFDLDSRKVNFYDYSGEFLESKKIPFLFTSMAYMDSTNLVFDLRTAVNRERQELNEYYLVTSDFEGNLSSKLFPNESMEINVTFWNRVHLQKFGEKVFYFPRFSSTIYEVFKDQVQAFYSLDFQGKGLSDEFRKASDNNHYTELGKNKSYFHGEFVDLEDYGCFNIITPKGICHLLYSKESNKSILFNRLIIDDFLFSFFQYPFSRHKDNKIVTFAHAHQVISMMQALYVDDNSRKDLFADLTVNDNPVLFFYDLKKF